MSHERQLWREKSPRRGFFRLRHLLPWQACQGPPGDPAVAILAEGAFGEPAPSRGRAGGEEGSPDGATELEAEGRAEYGDFVPSSARVASGLHRSSRGGRPGGDARVDRPDGRRSEEDQPAAPRRPGDRPFRTGRPIRFDRRLPRKRRAGVRTKPGALLISTVGAAGFSKLPRGSAGYRDLPPGQSGVPGERGISGARDRLSRYFGGNR